MKEYVNVKSGNYIMILILKPLYELITGEFSLFNNIIFNYIAMFAILRLSYKIAFEFVGEFYVLGLISGSEAGSLLHWIIRFIFFIILFYIFTLLIWMVQFFMTISWWVWTIIGVTLLLVTIMIVIIVKITSCDD